MHALMQGLMQGLRCASLHIVVRPLALEWSLSSSASSIVAHDLAPDGNLRTTTVHRPRQGGKLRAIREPRLLCRPLVGATNNRIVVSSGGPPQLCLLTTRLRSVGGPRHHAIHWAARPGDACTFHSA